MLEELSLVTILRESPVIHTRPNNFEPLKKIKHISLLPPSPDYIGMMATNVISSQAKLQIGILPRRNGDIYSITFNSLDSRGMSVTSCSELATLWHSEYLR